MAIVFNPFTGTFDFTAPGGGGGSFDPNTSEIGTMSPLNAPVVSDMTINEAFQAVNDALILDTVVPVNTPAVAGMNPQQTAEALQGQINNIVDSNDIVGDIYEEGLASGTLTANWTILAGTTATETAGTSINLSGGAGVRGRGIVLKNFITASDKWEINTQVKLNSVGNAGFAFSLNDPDSVSDYVDIRIDPTTAASTALSVLIPGSTLVGISSYNDTLNCSANDVLDIKINLFENVLIVNVSNRTPSVTQSIQYTYTMPSFWGVLGNFAMHTWGGSQSLLAFKYTDNNLYGSDYLVLADSIGRGYSAGEPYYRFSNILNREYGMSIINFSGVGKTQVSFDKDAVFNTIQQYGVRTIIVQVGTNAATNTAGYTSLISRIATAGYNIILLNLVDRTLISANITTFNAYQKSTYSATYPIIDINTLLGANTNLQYFDGDNVHPIYGGNKIYARAIASYLKVKNINRRGFSINKIPSIDAIQGVGTGATINATFASTDTVLSTSTVLTFFPNEGYLLLFKISTGATEFIYYSSRTENSFKSIRRGLFGSTAFSIASTADVVCGFVSKIVSVGETTTPSYFEYGRGYLGAIWGAGLKGSGDQFMFNILNTRRARFHSDGDTLVTFSKPATGNNSTLQWSYFTGITETNVFLLRHDATNMMVFKAGSQNVWTVDSAGTLTLYFKTGSNLRAGTATLVAGTVTIANTSVTAATVVLMSVSSPGGTQGFLSFAVSAGVSFTITSSSVLDTSVIKYTLVEFI